MDLGLSQAIGRTLRDFRATHGDAVFDRERCGSALLDMHRAHPAAIRAALAAIDSGGARRLLTIDRALAAAAIESETRRLVGDFAMAPEFARGAMVAWATALGLDSAAAARDEGQDGRKPIERVDDAAPISEGKTGGSGKSSGHRMSTRRRVVLSVGALAAAALALFVFQRVPLPTSARVEQVRVRMEAPASWQPARPGESPDRRARRLVVRVTVWNPASVSQAMPTLRAVAAPSGNDRITLRDWFLTPGRRMLDPLASFTFDNVIVVDDGADLERTTQIWVRIGD